MPKVNESKKIPISLLKELKENLSIKNKHEDLDWQYLLVGLCGGLYTDLKDHTLTLKQLVEILTGGYTQRDLSKVLRALKKK